MRRDDPTPDERLTEVASILARGLLRLKTQRFILPRPSESETQEEQISSQKPLELTRETRRHVLTGRQGETRKRSST